ncbi:DUF982 domain-containing protein [Ancylobacter defluvii]|uniref:DUF982 domain-containing protein n=1 Tax=Ancylobacter defluvii TaxID=1282440 RepID=A0A9W6NBM2_9HYPH|nr:DUF982 domain-containing protein [Ancylobacter defluvii]MBS7589061.1 DUF982 domain-containing protein [Ancylobacter defluvii]GLK84671.1 hypothetical protein GCM10017653_27410 [Ancylobacter defluvii]
MYKPMQSVSRWEADSRMLTLTDIEGAARFLLTRWPDGADTTLHRAAHQAALDALEAKVSAETPGQAGGGGRGGGHSGLAFVESAVVGFESGDLFRGERLFAPKHAAAPDFVGYHWPETVDGRRRFVPRIAHIG